jgi:hypothetical protein
LLAHDWWFFPGTPVSSTTKTGRHDIAEILLKVALNTEIQIQKTKKSTLSEQFHNPTDKNVEKHWQNRHPQHTHTYMLVHLPDLLQVPQ